MLQIVQKNLSRYGLHVTVTEWNGLHVAYTTGLSLSGAGPERVAIGPDQRAVIQQVTTGGNSDLGTVHPDWHALLSVTTRYHLLQNLPPPSFALLRGPDEWLRPRGDHEPIRTRVRRPARPTSGPGSEQL